MIVTFGTDVLSPEWPGSTVCIGVFDGVHLGHQELIKTAVRKAEASNQPCVLMTFDRHPASVLAPDRVPFALATLAQNLEQFEKLGVAVTVVERFDRETAQTTAEEFLDSTLRARLRAERLVVGHDFTFGKGRVGTGAWLAERIETFVVPPLEMEGHRVSSSEIRALVAAGEMAHAASFLGRPFALRGIVIEGARLGRTLGYPTLNLALPGRLATPPDGVYAGWCETPYGRYMAATSIGSRPTFDGQDRTIEAHLLDYPGRSLYGRVVELGFNLRLRDEEKYGTPEELVRQIDADVEGTRKALR